MAIAVIGGGGVTDCGGVINVINVNVNVNVINVNVISVLCQALRLVCVADCGAKAMLFFWNFAKY